MNQDNTGIISSIISVLVEQRQNNIKRGFYWENQIAFAYNSEKMEGNPLTEEQMRSIFETHTITGRAISINHVRETENHFKMFDFMLDTLDKDLDSSLLKDYHRILKTGTNDDLYNPDFVVGGWKSVPNVIGNIQTTSPKNVESEITRLIKSYHSKDKKTYRDIVGFHAFFERIHPFQDGNGRIGRMIMFRECLRNNLVPFIVLDSEKNSYFRSLRTFPEQQSQFVRFAENMAELYLEAYSTLLPEHLLLPDFERFNRSAPSVSTMAQDFFTDTATAPSLDSEEKQ